jgi:hypothetical protein
MLAETAPAVQTRVTGKEKRAPLAEGTLLSC